MYILELVAGAIQGHAPSIKLLGQQVLCYSCRILWSDDGVGVIAVGVIAAGVIAAGVMSTCQPSLVRDAARYYTLVSLLD